MTEPRPHNSNGSRRGLLDLVERLGNRLPDPTVLFLIGAMAVMVLSAVASTWGWSVQPKRLEIITEPGSHTPGRPAPDESAGATRPTPVLRPDGRPATRLVVDLARNGGEPFRARSLLSADGLYYALSSMVDNFISFPPLGVVLVGMLGIGVAERSGFIGAAQGRDARGAAPNAHPRRHFPGRDVESRNRRGLHRALVRRGGAL
ncbi:MAG: AbgT family transporter [Phycisphaerales bacterium]|nr:AbgT family transporter [Phycisphaerales bacterium]